MAAACGRLACTSCCLLREQPHPPPSNRCPALSPLQAGRYAKMKSADGKEVIGWENIELISDRCAGC